MGLLRTRNDSTSSYQSASGTKNRKANDLTVKTAQRNQRASKELKTGTNTNTSVISGVKRPPKRRQIYIGRLSQHISVTEMKENCETNRIQLIHIRQVSRMESQLNNYIVFLCLKMKKSSQQNFRLKMLPCQDSIWTRKLVKSWKALKKDN